MKSLAVFVFAMGVFAISGCGKSGGSGGGSAALDCAWLTGNNCWKTTVAGAAACLPGATDQGTLSSDGSACTYSNGRSVAFDDPLTLPVPSNKQWKFSLNNGGLLCLRYEDAETGQIKLTTAAGVFLETASGYGVTVTCPDGSRYTNWDSSSLLNCPGGSAFDYLPGSSWFGSDTEEAFSLRGTQGGGTQVFDCKKP